MEYDVVKGLLQERYMINDSDFADDDAIEDYIYHINDEYLVFPTKLYNLCNNEKGAEFVNLIAKLDDLSISEGFKVNIKELIYCIDDMESNGVCDY